MFRLFHSIFGAHGESDRYPETLVKAAVERAVDATDPWLRGLSGYRKALRPAVIKAIDHVVKLVDGLAEPLSATKTNYGHSPLLQAYFLSSEQMRQVLCAQLPREQTSPTAIYALLAMAMEERRTFGVELRGETLARDVPQVTIGFTGHRVIDPAGSELHLRRHLKRRAFDHLLSLALNRMVAVKELREDLDNRQALLQAKLELLQRGSWGFEFGKGSEPVEVVAVEGQLKQIHDQLHEIGGDDRALEAALDILIEVLGRPEEQLWSVREVIVVDRMGIKRTVASDDAPELVLEKVCNREGRSLVVNLIDIPVGSC